MRSPWAILRPRPDSGNERMHAPTRTHAPTRARGANNPSKGQQGKRIAEGIAAIGLANRIAPSGLLNQIVTGNGIGQLDWRIGYSRFANWIFVRIREFGH